MAKRKILIVDDEVSITKLLKLALERSGRYEVRCENEGLKALPAAQAFAPDLILLDVNLPDTSGGEVSAAFQEDTALKNIPVIFLTGMVSQEEVLSGVTVGGHPALAKPIDLGKLAEYLDQYLPA